MPKHPSVEGYVSPNMPCIRGLLILWGFMQRPPRKQMHFLHNTVYLSRNAQQIGAKPGNGEEIVKKIFGGQGHFCG